MQRIMWTNYIPVEIVCYCRVPRLCLLNSVPPFTFCFRLTGWVLKVRIETVFTRCLKVKTSLIYVSTKM
jgi:hypothetical protein